MREARGGGVTLDMITDYAGKAFLIAGAVFMLAGTFGAVFRMPDFYTRLHAAGVTDSLGLSTFLLGAMLLYGFSLMTAKLALLTLFMMITAPAAAHALGGAAYRYDEARARGAFADRADGEL